MFIAMNRFKIVKGKEKEFEDVWKNRDTHLQGVNGFKEFHLVKGNESEDHTYMHLIVFGLLKMHLLIGQSQKLLGLPIKMLDNIRIFT